MQKMALIFLGLLSFSCRTMNSSQSLPSQIIGNDDLICVETIDKSRLQQISDATGRVEVANEPKCSGIRISKNLFLTNHHCISACDTLQFRFGVTNGLINPYDSKGIEVKCTKLITSNENLEYAIFEFDPSPINNKYPIAELLDDDLNLGQRLFVAGYPDGDGRHLDISESCLITDPLPFSYDFGQFKTIAIKTSCDTKHGSSGSPVFDYSSGVVVALHFAESNDGSINWNAAVPMNKILDDLKVNFPSIHSQLKILKQRDLDNASFHSSDSTNEILHIQLEWDVFDELRTKYPDLTQFMHGKFRAFFEKVGPKIFPSEIFEIHGYNSLELNHPMNFYAILLGSRLNIIEKEAQKLNLTSTQMATKILLE